MTMTRIARPRNGYVLVDGWVIAVRHGAIQRGQKLKNCFCNLDPSDFPLRDDTSHWSASAQCGTASRLRVRELTLLLRDPVDSLA